MDATNDESLCGLSVQDLVRMILLWLEEPWRFLRSSLGVGLERLPEESRQAEKRALVESRRAEGNSVRQYKEQSVGMLESLHGANSVGAVNDWVR